MRQAVRSQQLTLSLSARLEAPEASYSSGNVDSSAQSVPTLRRNGQSIRQFQLVATRSTAVGLILLIYSLSL
ncbi:MAG TPA: hypothetical protein PK129_03430 [Cellvibrionaceae bacterium]|nr:hypothetical protein [Cellvibrionaceae bacterium]